MYRKKLMRACLAGIMAATVVGSSVPAYAAEPEGAAQEETVQEERTVYVSFATEDGVKVSDDVLPIQVSGTTFHTSKLTKLPAGYELCSVGDVYVGEADAVTVTVREKAVEERTVYVKFETEDGKLLDDVLPIKVSGITFHTDKLTKLPAGYELCSVGDVYVGEADAVTVTVREKAVEERTVYVKFETEDGKLLDDVLPIKVSGTTFHTDKLTKLPAGYELCSVGDVYVGEADAVTVTVRKVETVKATVLRVVYRDEATQEVVGEETLTGGRQNEEGNYIFNADIDFNIPAGYEVAVNYGDIEVAEGTASSMECLVKKASEFEYAKVTYVDADGGFVVGYGTAKVEKGATYFNTSILTDVPYGYEIAEVGDMPIANGEAIVKVRKIDNVQEVTITYVHKTTGAVVGYGKLNAYKNEAYFNTSRLTDIPEGYVLADAGDMPIENGAATVYVYAATDMEELQPSTPVESSKPVEPSKPEKPNKNEGTTTDDKKKDDKKDNKKDDKKVAAKTGDETSPIEAVLPAGISLAAVLALLKKRK